MAIDTREDLLVISKVRLANSYRCCGQQSKAQKVRAEAVRLQRRIKLNPYAKAEVACCLAFLASNEDQRVQALIGLEKAIEYYGTKDLHRKGEALMTKAELQRHSGDPPDVYISTFNEGTSLLNRLRDPVVNDIADINRLTYHILAGMHAEAAAGCQSTTWAPESPPKIQAYKLAMMGCLALAERDSMVAAGQLNEAISTFQNLGSTVDVACSYLCLAEASSLDESQIELRHYGTEAIRIFRQCGHTGPAKRAKWALKKLARGEWERPLACFDAVRLTAGPIANLGG